MWIWISTKNWAVRPCFKPHADTVVLHTKWDLAMPISKGHFSCVIVSMNSSICFIHPHMQHDTEETTCMQLLVTISVKCQRWLGWDALCQFHFLSRGMRMERGRPEFARAHQPCNHPHPCRHCHRDSQAVSPCKERIKSFSSYLYTVTEILADSSAAIKMIQHKNVKCWQRPNGVLSSSGQSLDTWFSMQEQKDWEVDAYQLLVRERPLLSPWGLLTRACKTSWR